MADFLLIHIDSQFDITQVISYDKATNTARRLAAEQIKSSLTSKSEVILLVPASWVYLTNTQIASRSADILEKSIPYSVEDELVNDIEDNYYAWQVQSEQQQNVAVISKDKRHQINHFIKKQQLPIAGIYSEAVFCPAKVRHLSVWQDNTQQVLLRFGHDAAMVATEQQLPELIKVFGQTCQHLLTNKPNIIDTTRFESVSTLSLADCCTYLVAGNEVNLYRGEDRDTEQQQSISWLKPLWAAGFLILSWLLVNGYQAWQLSSDITALKTQQQDILKAKFGDLSATEQRDPFAAMQSRLKQVDNQNQPVNILLDGLHFLGEARRQQQNIALKGIRLFDNSLEIQVTAPTISDINDYRQQLQNLAFDYRVNIGVNELADGVYQSILTMRPR